MVTNRQWLESLNNEQLSKFLTVGLRVKSMHYIDFPFDISISAVARQYSSSVLGVEKWLEMPQDYEIVKDGDEE